MVPVLLLLVAIHPFSNDSTDTQRIMDIARVQGYETAANLVQSQHDCTPYEWGMTLSKDRPITAATWFRGLYEVHKDPWYRYGIAYCLWRSKDNVAAMKAVTPIIDSQDELVRAHSMVLLSNLYEDTNLLEEAINHLKRAILIFEENGQFEKVYIYHLHMARLEIGLKRFSSAERSIEDASKAYFQQPSEESDGSLFEVRGILAMSLGQYEMAIFWTEQATEAFEIDDNKHSAALSKTYSALCWAWIGKLEKAEQLATEIDSEILHLSFCKDKISAYNSLAWAKVMRCYNLEDSIFLRDAKQWAAQSGDTLLVSFLSTDQSIPCQGSMR